MARLANQGKTQIQVREQTASLVRRCKPKDYRCEIIKCFEFVRDRIRYIRDIQGVETVADPLRTLQYGYGDCDDKTTLLAAMLESIGHPARFVAMGQLPGMFNHVFLEVLLEGEWISLDPTEPVKAGWRPKGIASLMIEPIP